MPKKLQPILEDIVRDPSAFGGPDTYRNIVSGNHLIEKYRDYMVKHTDLALEIYREGASKADIGDVFFHFQLQSDSNSDVIYDVVLRFWTDDPKVRMEDSIRNYHIQVFDNSPGFCFQYAYAYNKHKLLIEELKDHYSEMLLRTPAEKSNPNSAIGYDYTLFFALYHLKINPYYLSKSNISLYGTNLSRFNPDNIHTSKEVYEARTKTDLLSFNTIKRKSHQIEKKLKDTWTKFVGGGKQRAQGTKKPVKSSRVQRAMKAQSASRKHRYFK